MNLASPLLPPGRLIAIGLVTASAMAGCVGGTSGETATPIPLATATSVPPSVTPVPSDTPEPTPTATITPTATPSVLTVTPKEGDIACRFGPDSGYSVENALLAGQVVPIRGRDESSGWIQIDHPKRPGWLCWVEAASAVVDGDLGRAAVVSAPETFVESIQIPAHSLTFRGAACSFPMAIEVNYYITTNGPARVIYFEARNGAYGTAQTMVFPYADTQRVVDVYTLTGPGDYSLVVEVTSPNSLVEAKEFTVSCAP